MHLGGNWVDDYTSGSAAALAERVFSEPNGCGTAVEIIRNVANERFGLSLSRRALAGKDDQLAFRCFQIATLELAFLALKTLSARARMGVKPKR